MLTCCASPGQAPSPDQTEEDLKDQEQNILQLGEKYREEGKAKEMSNLIKQVRQKETERLNLDMIDAFFFVLYKVRPFLKLISKAKAAKLVRGLVDMFLDMERQGKKGQVEVQLCKVNGLVSWLDLHLFNLVTFCLTRTASSGPRKRRGPSCVSRWSLG